MDGENRHRANKLHKYTHQNLTLMEGLYAELTATYFEVFVEFVMG